MRSEGDRDVSPNVHKTRSASGERTPPRGFTTCRAVGDVGARSILGAWTGMPAGETAVEVAALPASLIAGWLWDTLGHGAPFLYGAGMAARGAGIFALGARRYAAAGFGAGGRGG